ADEPGRAPDPAALVERLGAPRYAEREAAAAALERAGAAAVPALRAGRRARDPEVRARAAALLERVESALMVRPTAVRLDYRDRPLTDVVADLATQCGMPVLLDPENAQEWSRRRVSLREDGPVTFWRALDRLCREGGLHAVVGPRSDPFDPGPGLGVTL